MESRSQNGLTLEVADVSQQKKARLSNVPPETTIHELVESVRESLALPRTGTSGSVVRYHARLDRERRHLGGNERVGGALQEGDQLILHPSVDAAGTLD
ncbi:MAG: hypothetical protein ACE5GW_04595 [Planctomycetota bacterium]